MSKKKNNITDLSDDDFFASLAEDTGGMVFEEVGNVPYFIDSGNLAINYICSGKFLKGGIPGGRITEAAGPEGSGKSLLGYCLLNGIQRMDGIGFYIDCERAGNAEFAKQVGHVNPRRLVSYDPPTLEQVESVVISATKAARAKYPDKPILFIWDSIGVTMCEREWREVDLPPDYTAADYKRIVGGKEQPGERAKVANKVLRKLNPFMNDNNASMYIVNQLRDKVGVVWGDPTAMAGGGNALKYYASCRLRTAAQKKIENKKLEIPIGINLKVTNKKNRSHVPGLNIEGIQLYYKLGINPLGGLLSVLIGAERVTMAKKGIYQVLEPYAGGRDLTFQSSVVRNDVPASILYECPILVDAESEEEIRNYLNVFAGAIDMSNSDDVKETDAQEAADELLG